VTFFNSSDVRVSILEEKLQSYEDLSKKMLSQLEKAVEKISESNSNISQILIRHDEKIERVSEEKDVLNRLIQGNEYRLSKQIETNRSAIQDLKNFRWLWAGAILASSFFFSQFKIVEYFMPQQPVPVYEIPSEQVCVDPETTLAFY
jgi:hypothetical protein